MRETAGEEGIGGEREKAGLPGEWDVPGDTEEGERESWDVG